MLTNDRVYVDVHVLQTVPPSCVNRDDTGSPKTAIYGGAVRARVSSQSWKKAMRTCSGYLSTRNLVYTKLIVKWYRMLFPSKAVLPTPKKWLSNSK